MPRTLCPKCLRPERTCLCDLVIHMETAVEVVIWQHPSETNHPKSSATLLQLSLADTKTLVAEQCSKTEFEAWCNEGDGCGNGGYDNGGDDAKKTNVILSPLSAVNSADVCNSKATENLRLIVIDGTWRKARKICHLNPWLQSLPALTLKTDHQPLYEMRKAEKAGQFSTLEATCLALAQLERNPHKYQPLLHSFAEFNRRWDRFRD